MATFFDVNNSNDIALLHPEVRESPELVNQIDRVEYQVLQYYKQRDQQGRATYQDFFTFELGRRPGSEIRVRLVGYNAETPADSEAGLKEALKRTIADIASYTLRNLTTQPGIASQSQGNRSVTFSNGQAPTWQNWQPGWNLYLRNYDARIQGYGI